MKLKPLLSFLLLYCILFPSKAQYSSCIVMMSTIIDNQPVMLRSTDGVLILNSKSGDLTLKVNSSSLINEDDTVNFHLLQNDEDIIFTGNIQNNILQLINLQGNSGKNFPMTGTLNINATSIATTANYNALKVNNERDDLFRNLKMSVFITFPATSARLNKNIPNINGDVLIQVNEATTNIIE